MDTTLFDRAVRLAVDAHSGTSRRDKGYPYMLHPMEAATIVASMTDDPEMLAAALLHDIVEDTDVTLDQIRDMFGERVAALVQHETSPLPHDAPWRQRRQAQADLLAQAPRDSQIVALGLVGRPTLAGGHQSEGARHRTKKQNLDRESKFCYHGFVPCIVDMLLCVRG